MRTQDYAWLADHSYDREGTLARLVGETLEIGGVRYRLLEHADTRSGYQGTIYQRADTNEIVVAHRGTEFDREKWRDLAIADGAMVAARTNPQAGDAIALTLRAIRLGQEQRLNGVAVPSVTTTGHSLGGTLAQISAHHFGLRGETFNAYGAVGLDRRIPAGGGDVVNHVMGADLVSAASPHFGAVRVYTHQREIDTLAGHGYDNDRRTRSDLRNPVAAALAGLRGGSHDMHNFLPVDGQGRPDASILHGPEARRLADQYDPVLDEYRADVLALRRAATLGLRGGAGLIEDAVEHLRGPLPPGAPAQREEDRRSGRAPGAVPPSPQPRSLLFGPAAPLGELPAYRGEADVRAPFRPGHAPPPPADPCRLPVSDMRDPAHPAHARYLQAHAGVAALERAHGREPGASAERLAAALTASSAGLPMISHVLLSTDGRRLFAVDTPDLHAEWRQRAHVEVDVALLTPLEASHRRWQASSEALAPHQDAVAMREPPLARTQAPTLA